MIVTLLITIIDSFFFAGREGKVLELIDVTKVQEAINARANHDVYLHLETTNGAYASHNDQSFFSAGAYIRNALVRYEIGKIKGNGPYRVGLKIHLGWVYAEGLTHFEVDELGRLLLAGHDHNGKLAVALEISSTPFE
jgi:hypothetical protein